MLLKKLPLTPYVVELWIILTDNPTVDIPKINKKYKGIDITWDDLTAAWTNDHIYDDNIIAVALDARDLEPDTIAHEAVHIVNRMFKHAGQSLDIHNDEHQAYFTGWIVGEIHKAYDKFKKKPKK
jgi:hypothetical protein